MTSRTIGLLSAANSPEQILYRAPFKKDDGKVRPNGPTLIRMRKQRGYSRERLAELTGIAIKTLRNLETKLTYRCYPCTIGTLAKYYGVESSAIILPEDQPGLTLLTSVSDIIEAKRKIVTSAQTILACIGSRTGHEELMRLIEATLELKPSLIHYRTMSLPPFKKAFQKHLLNMLTIRNPHSLSNLDKTLHIGIYACLVRQSEPYIYANESMALVMLPCVSGVGNYSTAVLFENDAIAQKYIEHAKSLYQMGKVIETEQAIRKLGLITEEKYQIIR